MFREYPYRLLKFIVTFVPDIETWFWPQLYKRFKVAILRHHVTEFVCSLQNSSIKP